MAAENDLREAVNCDQIPSDLKKSFLCDQISPDSQKNP